MNKAVVAVFKMVIGGKAEKWFLDSNYANMVKIMKAWKRAYITDLEAVKALIREAEDSNGKECYIVTKKEFDRLTTY